MAGLAGRLVGASDARVDHGDGEGAVGREVAGGHHGDVGPGDDVGDRQGRANRRRRVGRVELDREDGRGVELGQHVGDDARLYRRRKGGVRQPFRSRQSLGSGVQGRPAGPEKKARLARASEPAVELAKEGGLTDELGLVGGEEDRQGVEKMGRKRQGASVGFV